MTIVGAGGVVLRFLVPTERFRRDYRKLDAQMQARVDDKLRDLLKNPRPSGLAFEKLKGYTRPDVYTIHITGNYKLSLHIEGDTAVLRRVACHDDIDRLP